MSRAHRLRPAPRGFTLVEVAVVLAVVMLLLGLSVPSMSSWLGRQRLRAAAEGLSADMNLARLEAARSGRPVHLSFNAAYPWCYALGLSAGADCRWPDAQVLKVVNAADHPGVRLISAAPALFGPRPTKAQGTAPSHGRFASDQGEQITVRLSRLGRPGLCTPEAPLPPLGAC